jgi:PAS domain S-box-containing protein
MAMSEKSREELLADISALQKERASLQDKIRFYLKQADSFRLEDLVTRVSTDFINIDPSQVDEKIEKALGVIADFVCVDRSYVFTFSEDGAQMDNTHEWCRQGVEPQMHRLQGLKTNTLPWFSKKIKALENVVVPRVFELPPEARSERQEWETEHIQSLICVPMVCRDRLVGFVGFDCVLYQNEWSEQVVKILRVVGDIFANLLDRKQAEQALRKSEETYRTLVNNVDLGITLIGNDHRIIMTNSAICKMFKKEPADFIGKKCFEQFEKRDEICTHCPGEVAMATGTHADVETSGIRDDGSRFSVQIRAFPLFNEDGEPRGFIEVVKDLTHIKQAERTLEESRRMLQMVLDNIPVRVFWKDCQSNYLGCNHLFAEDVGLERNREIAGKTDDDLPWKDRADLYRKIDVQVTESGSPKLNYEELQARSDGEDRWVKKNKVPLRDLEGKIVGVLGTYEDVTERKEIEQERENLLRALSVKTEELESIVYISSHDLRSPLVNIKGFSAELENSFTKIRELISDQGPYQEAFRSLEDILDEVIPEALQYIHASADKMDMLLKALLRLSRLGRVELKITAVSMNQLLQEILKSMQFQITESRAEIIIEDLPDCMGDKGQIGQVLSNILDNAIKYLAPDRKGMIRVTGEVTDRKAVYCVEDNGIGIAKEHQGKVFEIFHRLDPFGSVPGEGIGLTMAQRVLMRQNGNIRLESELGTGTRFYVELPVSRDTRDRGCGK